MTKEVILSSSKDGIIKGMHKLADAVSVTLGPKGRLVALDKSFGLPVVTKDGVSVAKSIELSDRLENIGASIMREAASKTAELAGDGPQPLYSKILTPSGWTTMGEIKVGDLVTNNKGESSKVIGVFPKGKRDVYEITLSSGKTARSCKEHLWLVQEHKGENIEELVVTLGSFMKKIGIPEETSYFIPVFNPILKLIRHEFVVSCNLVGEEDVQCIMIDSDDHLYITDDYIVTHNTTSSTVIAQAIVKESQKYLSAGSNPIDLKRGFDLAMNAVVENLKNISQPVVSSEEIINVASISANSDKEVGKLISTAIEKVGHKGVVTIENSSGFTDSLVVVDGLKFDSGFTSNLFVTNQEKQQAILDNPYILLTNKKISNPREILSILEKVSKTSRPLLIIADDYESDVLGFLVANHLRGVLKVIAVKSPSYGETKQNTLLDIAIVTGGQVVSEESGLTFDTIEIDQLGESSRVESTKNFTTIIGGNGSTDGIQERIRLMERQIEIHENEFEKNKIRERLAKLSGGVAIIKVGASTEVELKEKKDRIEDALAATRAAIEEGIVPGGGVALLRSRFNPKSLKHSNEDQLFGIKIILKCLESPLRQIVKNAGLSQDLIIDKVTRGKKDFGFDAQTSTYTNMLQSGIIDPAKVVRLSLQHAVSVAAMLISIEASVVEVKDNIQQGGIPPIDPSTLM